MSKVFSLKSSYSLAGDQPQAVEKIMEGLKSGMKHQTLLGVTGSGKTFTMANVIAKTGKPTLVIAHNKTLAAQLCTEFRTLFPRNAVHYFVSYYDYYQPEAYVPTSDTYIDKEAQINDEIDKLRHAATQSLLSREDVIIVASVSCIYGLGSPKEYKKTVMHLESGQKISREILMNRFIGMFFERTNSELKRGFFRTRGENFEIMPISAFAEASADKSAGREIYYRIEIENQKIKEIKTIDHITKKILATNKDVWIFPSKHFITSSPERDRAVKAILKELGEQTKKFKKLGKLLEVERITRRTKQDVEMLKTLGYCHGIENYSRHLSGRAPGEAPATLLDYFPKDFLMIIDESHITVPQIRGMFEGDASRKKTLVDYGFRLPSAMDNRPLQFPEFEKRMPQVIYTTATPNDYEIKHSAQIVEQIIRPTGLIDPKITVCPVTESKNNIGQIEDIIIRIKERAEVNERTLVTTLTKKMAEELSAYLKDEGVKSCYIHSEVQTLDRIRILTDFRRGKYDCLVGVNLLREGLDLPEVSLVGILDADKEGFLRSETSLIQTIGRAARNVRGEVVLYADGTTGSMERAISETERRRKTQVEYNEKYHIIPKTIIKEIKDILPEMGNAKEILKLEEVNIEKENLPALIREKEEEMREAANTLDFETAAILRDEIKILKKKK
jgi:excinuclease ABC subunit B